MTNLENVIGSIGLFISGIGIWELFKFFYPDLRRKIDSFSNAKRNLFENLDPILKACDELYGKLQSLAKEDFATFINISNSNSNTPEHNAKYVAFLFAQFWAQLEYIRLKSQYSSITRIKKGRNLLRFIETYESRAFRLLDRSVQRIIGESLIIKSTNDIKVMTLYEFMKEINSPNSELKLWVDKLLILLNQSGDKSIRQRILIFGVIVAALIDHFDPKSKVVRRRSIYINKLSEKSKKSIKNSLISHYLPFLKNKSQYY